MKKILLAFILFFTLIIFWINAMLYSENYTYAENQNDIILQQNFIGRELKTNNLGQRMQAIFPEGFVFVNALYGLTWCELGMSEKINEEVKKRSLNEALYAYKAIDSDEAKQVFEKTIIPEYGIYYVGWKNYLLAKILALDTTFTEYKVYKSVYLNQCEVISAAVNQSTTPYLSSYTNQSWPADIFVAMVSLKIHDKIFNQKYSSEINNWIINVKKNLDPYTKMIPHKTDSENGNTIEGARGCSISLILRFLAEIDSEFAKNQFTLYKRYFYETTFGLPSIREYPKGLSGFGDIDSGPVILGVGFAGTIVAIGTFAKFGHIKSSVHPYNTINAFGFPFKTNNEKKYIFGLLPIADAFIAWGRSSSLNSKNLEENSTNNWRLKFHYTSILAILLVWIPFYFRSIFNIINQKLFLK